MSKIIKLTRGQQTIVDDEDYERLIKQSWYAIPSSNNTFYARGSQNRKSVFLHRVILNVTDSNIKVDHINGNKLDNRKENLRICTTKENNRNRPSNKNSSSKYKGVMFRKRCTKNPWEAAIEVNDKYYYLGNFKEEEQAAKAYNNAALKYFGEFARLNMIKGD